MYLCWQKAAATKTTTKEKHVSTTYTKRYLEYLSA